VRAYVRVCARNSLYVCLHELCGRWVLHLSFPRSCLWLPWAPLCTLLFN
jgi:hypothetical protein